VDGDFSVRGKASRKTAALPDRQSQALLQERIYPRCIGGMCAATVSINADCYHALQGGHQAAGGACTDKG